MKELLVMLEIAQLPVVELTLAEFQDLGEYSCTFPTGVRIGKRWKRNENFQNPHNHAKAWLLGEYVPSPTHPDTHCATKWSRIALVGP